MINFDFVPVLACLIVSTAFQEDMRGDDEGHPPGSPCESHVVYPAYTQNLPANCRAMLLSDTGGRHFFKSISQR